MDHGNETILQTIDGVPCRLKEPFDFCFLSEYGKVFRVFDSQSSGCICFGVSNDKNRYFIKFAGAETINNHGLPVSDAVARLKAAVPKYKDLKHPLLIRFIEGKPAGGGYMTVFDWEDGESFGIENPAARAKFLTLPMAQKVHVFEEILRFHGHVAKCGYVALDFNDNSTLYHFDTGKIKICDIDFYAKQSYINGMGRALGDPAVMSPEEYRIGGLLDEITNVYTMGATAFVLFSDNNRLSEAWPLSAALYAVVKKSISEQRQARQQTIEQLITEWNRAKAAPNCKTILA
ncbi:MAG: serine/threonine protein kinase [Eubacteriales bacterium]|nr:serine/threonine protein kinase [Eubacteriales bacterium]